MKVLTDCESKKPSLIGSYMGLMIASDEACCATSALDRCTEDHREVVFRVRRAKIAEARGLSEFADALEKATPEEMARMVKYLRELSEMTRSKGQEVK